MAGDRNPGGGGALEQPADPSVLDAWQPVDPTEPTYDIERIVSAEPRGSGWTLQVKWKGFDEITPEPLGRILRDTRGHTGILAEIDQCKADYYLKNPKKVPVDEEQDDLPEPSRVQPSRPTRRPRRTCSRSMRNPNCRIRQLGL